MNKQRRTLGEELEREILFHRDFVRHLALLQQREQFEIRRRQVCGENADEAPFIAQLDPVGIPFQVAIAGVEQKHIGEVVSEVLQGQLWPLQLRQIS